MATSPAAVGDVLIDADAISRRVNELAAAIDAHYAGANSALVVLCVLSGALMFTADLVRRLTVACELEFAGVTSYGAHTQSSGTPVLTAETGSRMAGRDVLIVEDIVDTGLTVAFLHDHLLALGARSVGVAALLNKRARRSRQVTIDWIGFEIPDRFVVGYGLDHAGRHRNLPDVHVLDGA